MMPGTKEMAFADEIREHLDEFIPNACFIPRRTTNHGAMVVDRRSGKVLMRGDKNWEIKEQLTNPDGGMKKTMQPLVEVDPTLNLHSHAENLARSIIDQLRELSDVMGEDRPVRLLQGEKGEYVAGIRFKAMDFTTSRGRER